MPIIDRDGAVPETWTRIAAAEALSVEQPLVPVVDIAIALAELPLQHALGVEIDNAIRVADLKDVLDRIALVAVAFPSFSDGRGFSIARQLRRQGYGGRLRAVGPLIADQFAYALACGFDEIELPEASAARQPPQQWLEALSIISHTYQRGYDNGGNILDQRRAARVGAGGGRNA